MQRLFPHEALVIQHEFGGIGVDAEDVLAVDDIVSAYTGNCYTIFLSTTARLNENL